MTNRKWTDDEVKAEIAAAVKIVNEDRERAAYTSLHAKYGGSNPTNDDGGNPNRPPAPPAKDPPDDDGGNAPKQSLWWGDRLND